MEDEVGVQDEGRVEEEDEGGVNNEGGVERYT